MSSVINNPLIGPLIKTSRVRTYNKGSTILYPEDRSSDLYVIKTGAVAMETISSAGDKKILYVFGPATLFPAVSFLESNALSSWFYTALTDTDVYVIPYQELSDKLRDADGYTAYNALLRQTLTHVHELLLQVSDHSKTDSNEKLISIFLFLLEYHTKKSSSAWRSVQFPVTHQLLAEMTGLARETVSLTLKELAKDKLVRFRQKGHLELNASNFAKQSHS